MNAIVSVSARFIMTRDGNLWTTNPSLSYTFWKRYLSVYDEVKLLVRAKIISSPPIECVKVSGIGISPIVLPYYEGPWQFVKIYPTMKVALRRSLKESEAVHLRVPNITASMILTILDDKYPYAVEVVGDPYDVFSPGSVRHPLRPFFRWWFSRQLRQQCYGACAASYVTAQALQKRYPPHPQAFTTSYSSIQLDPPAFVSAPRKPDVHRRSFTLILVGTLNQLYKSPDVLIDAVGRCVQQGHDLEVVFVGDGQHRQELEARTRTRGIAERVHFRGWLPAGEAVRNELDKADLFVLPSRQEGLPRAMVEAMARGLPCIGSTVGGIPELLPPEDMVPPGDVDALATKICEVLGSLERMEQMAARNLEKAQEYRSDLLHERRIQFYRYVRERTETWLSHKQ